VQIVKKHWRALLPGTSRLNMIRSGNSCWADSTGSSLKPLPSGRRCSNVIWVPFIALDIVAVPDAIYAVNIYRHLESTCSRRFCCFRACRSCPPWRWFGWSASVIVN
jgi:hypothetical protein